MSEKKQKMELVEEAKRLKSQLEKTNWKKGGHDIDLSSDNASSVEHLRKIVSYYKKAIKDIKKENKIKEVEQDYIKNMFLHLGQPINK